MQHCAGGSRTCSGRIFSASMCVCVSLCICIRRLNSSSFTLLLSVWLKQCERTGNSCILSHFLPSWLSLFVSSWHDYESIHLYTDGVCTCSCICVHACYGVHVRTSVALRIFACTDLCVCEGGRFLYLDLRMIYQAPRQANNENAADGLSQFKSSAGIVTDRNQVRKWTRRTPHTSERK